MKKILVPTDFSPVANNAVQYAVKLSGSLQSEVIIYHADQGDRESITALKKEVNKTVSAHKHIEVGYILSRKQFSSINVNDIIKDSDVDLIIMGTSTEYIPLEKKLFGKNTVEIAGHVSCPVIAVPDGYKFSGIKNIAYASDLNFIDKEIDSVINLAKMVNASIEIFHVSPVFPDLGDVEKINMSQKLGQIKQKFNFDNIHYEIEKTKNDNEVVKGISNFVDLNNVDLLVMFHDHVSALNEFLSTSTIEKVIPDIKIPLLVFPKH